MAGDSQRALAHHVRWPRLNTRLLLAEGVEAHDLLARLFRSGGGRVGSWRQLWRFSRRRLFILAISGHRARECQSELHRGVEEALDSGEGDDQRLGLVVKAEAHLERRLAD